MRHRDSRAQLQQGGGLVQVPCLRITDELGNVTGMYESRAIVSYLQTGYTTAARHDRS